MIGSLYFVELTVTELRRSLSWYEGALGLRRVPPRDDPKFALLDAGSTRLALKVGVAQPGSVLLTFEVADLAAALRHLAGCGIVPTGDVQQSGEGYRRAQVRDPDGYPVSLFEWVR